jgi:hypothetical protein
MWWKIYLSLLVQKFLKTLWHQKIVFLPGAKRDSSFNRREFTIQSLQLKIMETKWIMWTGAEMGI